MSAYKLIVIGGGLSGLAAGIRYARFGEKVLILEKHSSPGGLNSYYYRHGRLLETGLHAMTNWAAPDDRHATLNRLLRQLKLPRHRLVFHEQFSSEILFPHAMSLRFSNDFSLLKEEISRLFPQTVDRFLGLVKLIADYDPYIPRPRISARTRLQAVLDDDLLINMLFWPLMMYGNSEEHDMDFSQFVIMFRSIYQEGFFRPAGTIKDFLDLLLSHYHDLGGEIRMKASVQTIITRNNRVAGVRLSTGEEILGDNLISTIGYPNTLELVGRRDPVELSPYKGRMSFVELIYFLPAKKIAGLKTDRTIIFYQLNEPFCYCRPEAPVEVANGVICFPGNFKGLPEEDLLQLRITHPANYDLWAAASSSVYPQMKEEWAQKSQTIIAQIIGNYQYDILFFDSFTPLTIERFTGKAQGAVYGSPLKIKDGRTPFSNLFIAGTDQGYLGIIGSMFSGVTMVNDHILKTNQG